jgi:ubiquinone biosynthesis monooxygenase Coq7
MLAARAAVRAAPSQPRRLLSERRAHDSRHAADARSERAEPKDAATGRELGGEAEAEANEEDEEEAGGRGSWGPAERRAAIDRILRVDHAGEFGAVQIYAGQLAVTRDEATAALLRHMQEQEARHLADIEQLMPERRVRPTALLPLWHAAGFALGAGTALLGRRAAMACTVAVEEAIVEHYNNQLRELHAPPFRDEAALRELIRRNRDEEDAHRDTALRNEAELAPLYGALSTTIKAGCKVAIWLSERL